VSTSERRGLTSTNYTQLHTHTHPVSWWVPQHIRGYYYALFLTRHTHTHLVTSLIWLPPLNCEILFNMASSLFATGTRFDVREKRTYFQQLYPVTPRVVVGASAHTGLLLRSVRAPRSGPFIFGVMGTGGKAKILFFCRDDNGLAGVLAGCHTSHYILKAGCHEHHDATRSTSESHPLENQVSQDAGSMSMT